MPTWLFSSIFTINSHSNLHQQVDPFYSLSHATGTHRPPPLNPPYTRFQFLPVLSLLSAIPNSKVNIPAPVSGGGGDATGSPAAEAMAATGKFNRSNPAVKRILQEVKEMQSNPSPDFVALPLEVLIPIPSTFTPSFIQSDICRSESNVS